MKKHWMKRTALALILAMVLVVSGCSSNADVTWAAKLGEDTLPSGVYCAYLMMGYNDASSKITGEYDNLLREKVDDVSVPEYIVNYAKNETAKALAVREKFAALGEELAEADLKNAMDYASYVYRSAADYYRVNGVSETDIQYVYEGSLMSLKVFESIYGQGGEKEVPQEELMQEFQKNYTRSQYLLFPKIDTTTGAALSDEEVAKAKEQADEYLERAQAEGQSFTDLIHELELSRLTEDQEPYEKFDEPYYDAYLENATGYFPEAYEAAVLTGAEGSIQKVEDDQYVYIIKKLPIAEADQEAVDYYLSRILQNLKYDEFVTTMDEWGSRTDIVYNNDALKVYTPKNLKMTAAQVQAALLEEQSTSSSSSASDSGSSASQEPSSSESQGESDSSSESGSSAS